MRGGSNTTKLKVKLHNSILILNYLFNGKIYLFIKIKKKVLLANLLQLMNLDKKHLIYNVRINSEDC